MGSNVHTLKRPGKLEKPEGLSTEEAELWDSIVAALPRGFLNVANSHMLHKLCANSVMSSILSTQMAVATEAKDMQNLERLSELQARASRAVGNISTKLRLTPNSRHRH